MPSTTRTRLSPDARRAQLIEVGLELLRTTPLDQLPLDQVAAQAGTSRALLFHHFGSKQAFQVELVRAAGALLLEVTEPDPADPVVAQLRRGLIAFLEFVDEHRGSYVALVRGASASDDALGAVVDQVREALADRVLEGVAPGPPPDDFLRLRVRSWVALTEEAALQWTSSHPTTLEELVDFLVQALLTCLDPTGPPGPTG